MKKLLQWSEGFRHFRHQAHAAWHTFSENVIPNGANSVVIVALLKLQSNGLLSTDWKTEKLFTKQKPTVPLDVNHIKEIAQSLIDIVVFSKGAHTDRCEFAEQLAPALLQKGNYLLREYERAAMNDRSLSWCPQMFEQNIPLLPHRFRLSTPTPGAENSCTDGADPLIIEAILQSQAAGRENNMQQQPSTSQSLNLPEACGSPHQRTEILAEQDFHGAESLVEDWEDETMIGPGSDQNLGDLMTDALTIDALDSFQTVKNCDNTITYKYIDRSEEGSDDDDVTERHDVSMSMLFPECADQGEAEQSGSAAEAQLDGQPPAPKRRKCTEGPDVQLISPYCGIHLADVSRMNDAFYKLPDTDMFFKSEWTNYLSRNPKLITSPELEKWKEFLAFHVTNERDALMVCRCCLHNTVELYSGVNRWTNLANPSKYPGGFPLSEQSKENHKYIRLHMSSNQHQTIKEKLNVKRKAPIAAAFQVQAQKAQEKNTGKVGVTANMLCTVYAEVILNIPLHSHSEVMQLMEMNSARIGMAHQSRFSVTQVVEFPGIRFHNALVNHIKNSKTPLSLMWDTSTDKSDQQFLLVYIRALEDNYPHVYLFKTIELGISSTAATQFQSIVQAIAMEGLQQLLKNICMDWVQMALL